MYDVLVGVNEKLDSVGEVSSQDTQTVLGLLEEIKEQLHLKELEPSIEGVTGSEEEKQTLLNEIAEVRERLTGLENVSAVQSDAASAALANIEQDLNDIKESILVSDRAVAADSGLTDISEKLELIMQDSANMNQLTSIAADI